MISFMTGISLSHNRTTILLKLSTMKNTLLIIALFCFHSLVAQLPYNKHPKYLNANKNWVFANNTGISLGNNPPIEFQAENDEGTASRSVASHPISGEILFYANGSKIFNRNHQIMANDIISDVTDKGLIVPFVNDSNKYYLFKNVGNFGLQTTDNTNYSPSDSFSVFYSVVDMALENGLGSIDPMQKNIPLTPAGKWYSSAILAIPGECNDIWLLLHDYDSCIYEAWHIDENGINPNPVISVTEFPLNAIYNSSNRNQTLFNAQMKCSPDRTKILFMGNGYLTGAIGAHTSISSFNPSTGLVGDEIHIGYEVSVPDTSLSSLVLSAAFSPDNKKLYTLEILRDTSIISLVALYQYDISNFSKAGIDNSKKFIAHIDRDQNFTLSATGALQLYNDTIYLGGSYNPNSPKQIGIISQPNEPDSLCDYIADYLPIMNSEFGLSTMPLEVIYPFKANEIISFLALDTGLCASDVSNLQLQAVYGNNEFTYEWSTGATSNSIAVNVPGQYWVRYTNGCYTIVDTFRLTAYAITPPTITNNQDTLSTTSFSTYQWLKDGLKIPGATDSLYIATESGRYQVVVTNSSGCIDTSEVSTVDKEEDDTSIENMDLIKQEIKIHPNPANHLLEITSPIPLHLIFYSLDGKEVLRQSKSNKIDLMHLSPGIYSIKIFDTEGTQIKTERLVKLQ